MAFLVLRPRLPPTVAFVAGVVLVLASRNARAIGEPITDVRVLDNSRTEESTVRSIAGVSIGDTLEADTLDRARERLNTAGLFADVNIWWEPHGAGVRINIAVKDKFPWAPVPTASWSANNKAAGLLFVHGNVFRRGKQLLIGGRVASVDSGATIVYRDPALFGSWIYWQVQALIQRQIIPEFANYGPGIVLGDPILIRENHLWSYGVEPAIGISWFRRVRTQFTWRLEKVTFDESVDPSMTDPANPDGIPLTPVTTGGVVGVGRGTLTFDFRAREFAVMTGTALSGSFDVGSPDFKGDFTFWRAGASWEHGIKFFKSHNLIYFANAVAGHNMPFWMENTAGGPNLRGYLFQQFRGDTQLGGKMEYHFPLFSIGSLDFRALGFYDVSALWFRADLASYPLDPTGAYYERPTNDRRTFPMGVQSGFSWSQNIHQAVGGGVRFFLRSVAVPLIGFDAGYGLEAKNWRFFLIVGA